MLFRISYCCTQCGSRVGPDCGSEGMKTHRQAGMGALGSGREKPQQHRSSVCILYTERWGYSTQLNKEAVSLHLDK